MMAYRWQQWEIDFLFNHANEGLAEVAERLGRSTASVRNQASRYGVSLRRAYTCTRCGRTTYAPLHPTKGWCRICCVEYSRDKAARARATIQAELAREEKRLKVIERERQAHYAATHRAKKKLQRLGEVADIKENKQVKPREK